jgi:class 3 adenylate cyclase
MATERAQDILGAFGGDIDCFAGDAVLVVFSPLMMAAGTGDGGGDGVSLRESTRRAVECAHVAIATLSNFQSTPEDPPLQVHCGVASGDLRSGICGAYIRLCL